MTPCCEILEKNELYWWKVYGINKYLSAEQILPLVSRRTSEQVLLYKPKAEVCNACPVKSKCTGSKSGRHIFRSFFQEYLDKAESYRQTEAYLRAMRKRSVWVEPSVWGS